MRINALAETCGATLCRPPDERIQYLKDRQCAMLANNARIRGLASLLHAERNHVLTPLINALHAIFDARAWRDEVFAPCTELVRNAMRPSSILAWTPRPLLETCGDAARLVERVIQAERALRRSGCHAKTPCYVGHGNEGVVFRDGSDEKPRCFKVFDGACTGGRTDESLRMLCAVGVLKSQRVAARVLQYDYVHGTPYRGGHGPALVALLRRLYDAGIIMSNIKPDNLVCTNEDGALRIEIVDLGRDWAPLTPTLWLSTCRRAFLCWRFGKWADTREGAVRLCKLLRAESDAGVENIPELTGFDTFWSLCEYGPSPNVDARFERLMSDGAHPHGSSLSAHARKHTATLIIKTCLMETAMLLRNVRHIVWTLRRSGTAFADVILLVDRTRRDALLRQYAAVEEREFDSVLAQVRNEGLVDSVVDYDGLAMPELTRELNKLFLGVHDSTASHSANGVPHAPLFMALHSVKTEYVLQLDADICLNMRAPEDLIERAAQLFESDS